MQTPELPRRRLRGLAAIVILIGAVLVPASASMAMEPAQAGLETNDPEGGMAALGIDELRTLIEELDSANATLRAETATLQQSVESLTQERDDLQGSLARFDDLREPLEADRQLLLVLRKGLPETRPEAEAQLQRIRRLALSSDPAKLGRLVDRVEDAAPAFLEWRFTEFGSTQEATEAYIRTGANAFDSSMNELRDEVLMSVASRLDGLLTVLDRLR